MIEVKTKYPIAVDSNDHKYPEGVHYDNNVSMNFVHAVESNFNGNKINFLDLGCAGGALATTMHERGHKSVGIDGSDGCLNVRREVFEHFGKLPAGHDNWVKYYKTVLFTADITKEYQILDDNTPIKFDVISCWDVMEHFEPDSVDSFLTQVRNHLKSDGIFVGSIAMVKGGTGIQWEGVAEMEYHKSIFPRNWWMEKFQKQFETTNYPFHVCNREYINPNQPENGEYVVFCATIKK